LEKETVMNNYINFRKKVSAKIPLPIKLWLNTILVEWLRVGKIFFPERKWLPGWTIQMKVIGSLFIISLISIVFYLFQSKFDFAGVALNLGTEMLGAVITYLLIQNVIGKSETKEKLIINMRSKVRDVALQAIDELRQSNWLMDGSLKEANLNGGNLRGVELYGANLLGASLTGVNLSGAKLYGVKLAGANLFNADLSSAILNSTDLDRANLRQANLYGTDLSTVHNLNRADLNGAWYSDKTKWPDGFEPDEAGALLVYVNGKRIYHQDK